jgi:hypothetical protein
VVECAGLENRYTRKGIRGSNPLPTAWSAALPRHCSGARERPRASARGLEQRKRIGVGRSRCDAAGLHSISMTKASTNCYGHPEAKLLWKQMKSLTLRVGGVELPSQLARESPAA